MRLIPFLVNDDCLKQNFLKIKPPRINENAQISIANQIKNETANDDQKNNQNAPSSNQKSSTSITQHQNKSPSRNGNSIMGNPINKSQAQNKLFNATAAVDPQTEIQKFKEKLNALYDSVSQLGLLEESYKMMYPLIKQIEKKNQSLLTLHTSIKEDFLTLPGAVVKQIKYDQFEEKSKEDMIFAIEASWEKFRKILAFITKQ